MLLDIVLNNLIDNDMIVRLINGDMRQIKFTCRTTYSLIKNNKHWSHVKNFSLTKRIITNDMFLLNSVWNDRPVDKFYRSSNHHSQATWIKGLLFIVDDDDSDLWVKNCIESTVTKFKSEFDDSMNEQKILDLVDAFKIKLIQTPYYSVRIWLNGRSLIVDDPDYDGIHVSVLDLWTGAP